MLAANNLLKPSDGKPVAVPTQDMVPGSPGFTMVDVADGANVYMGFGSVEMLLFHLDCSSFYLRNFILLLFIKNRLFSAQGYFINSHKGLQACYEIYSSPVFARELMIVSAMDFGTSV